MIQCPALDAGHVLYFNEEMLTSSSLLIRKASLRLPVQAQLLSSATAFTSRLVSIDAADFATMKRLAPDTKATDGVSPKKKAKTRIELPEYHATPSRKNDQGEIVWPAPEDKMEAARSFILEWYARLICSTVSASALS